MYNKVRKAQQNDGKLEKAQNVRNSGRNVKSGKKI